ncbi:MAG: hypothetical protein ACHQNE_00370 [Candidatus Kapaibacterium sp.]
MITSLLLLGAGLHFLADVIGDSTAIFGVHVKPVFEWVGLLSSCLGIIGVLYITINWLWHRKIVLAVVYTPLGTTAEKQIGIAVRWKRGKPTIIHWLAIVCYAEQGVRHLVVSPSGITLNSSNQQQLFHAGIDEFPNDKIIGVAVQDSNGKWHYSKGFPKHQHDSD